MTFVFKIKDFLGKLIKFLVLTFFFSVFFIGIVVGGTLFQYNKWFDANSEQLEIAFTKPEAPVVRDLDVKLSAFEESTIQKETLKLSCEHVNALLYSVAEENWQNYDIQKIGVVCKDRSVTVYLRRGSNLWIIVDLWQKEEGLLDFTVFDVRIGSVSLGTLSSGLITGSITNGVKEALELVSDDNYSGRKITSIYIDDDGVKLVGEL